MITGHSLGGGLASAATIVTGFTANTFNAAGLSSTTINDANTTRMGVGMFTPITNPSSFISAYITRDDGLNKVQYLGSLIPGAGYSQALGTHIIIENENNNVFLTILSPIIGTVLTSIEAHKMPQIFYGLMYQYNN
jgi:hypothetical protein